MLEILTALILFKVTDAILQRFGDIQSYTELQTLCALITTRLCYYNFAKWMEIWPNTIDKWCMLHHNQRYY